MVQDDAFAISKDEMKSFAIKFQFRNLLIFDFSCALSAGIIFFIFFDFLIESLGLPRWVASAQLTANLLYGIFGLLIFFLILPKSFFLILVAMNFVYAIFAIGLSFMLFEPARYGGAILLLLEGLFILVLAKLELSTLPTNVDNQNKF